MHFNKNITISTGILTSMHVLQCGLLMAYFRDYDASDYFIVNTSKPLIWELRKPIHHQTLYVENNSSFNAVIRQQRSTMAQSAATVHVFWWISSSHHMNLVQQGNRIWFKSILFFEKKNKLICKSFSSVRKLTPCEFVDDCTTLAWLIT